MLEFLEQLVGFLKESLYPNEWSYLLEHLGIYHESSLEDLKAFAGHQIFLKVDWAAPHILHCYAFRMKRKLCAISFRSVIYIHMCIGNTGGTCMCVHTILTWKLTLPLLFANQPIIRTQVK